MTRTRHILATLALAMPLCLSNGAEAAFFEARGTATLGVLAAEGLSVDVGAVEILDTNTLDLVAPGTADATSGGVAPDPGGPFYMVIVNNQRSAIGDSGPDGFGAATGRTDILFDIVNETGSAIGTTLEIALDLLAFVVAGPFGEDAEAMVSFVLTVGDTILMDEAVVARFGETLFDATSPMRSLSLEVTPGTTTISAVMQASGFADARPGVAIPAPGSLPAFLAAIGLAALAARVGRRRHAGGGSATA